MNSSMAIITGVEGQDGSFLAEYLLSLNYSVIGVTKKSSVHELSSNLNQVSNNDNFTLELGDITDESFIFSLIQKYKPKYYFNLAALSDVGQSFKEPLKTFKVNAQSVICTLEAIRKFSPDTRYYQASTSEITGGLNCPIDGYAEDFIAHPRSPYGVSKMAAYWAVKNYREAYGLFASNGVLFNHSSVRRGYSFATRKITMGVAKIKLGLEEKLKMGNLEAHRDEAHAKDMVRGMYMILNHTKPDDFILATGETASIKDMLEYVCKLAELRLEDVYEMDERFMRPSEVPYLKGNANKALVELGWKPKHTWKDLLKEMYFNDLNKLMEDLCHSKKMER